MLQTVQSFVQNALIKAFLPNYRTASELQNQTIYKIDDAIIVFIFHVVDKNGSDKTIIELFCRTQENSLQSIFYEESSDYKPATGLKTTVYPDNDSRATLKNRFVKWQKITGQQPKKRVFVSIDERYGKKPQLLSLGSKGISNFICEFMKLINEDQEQIIPTISIKDIGAIRKFLAAHLRKESL